MIICASRLEMMITLSVARPQWRFADFAVHPVYPRFIGAIREDHSMDGFIVNLPVLIDTETGLVRSASGDAVQPGPGSGPGWPAFFDSPRFSPDGKHFIVRAWCVCAIYPH